MKKGLLIYFLLLSTFSFGAPDAVEAFGQGNAAYKDGNYQVALDLYLQAAEEAEGMAINYNIGNAYYKLGKIPQSILHYERALKFDPDNEDILHNLRVANEMIVDRIENLPQSRLNIWWREFRFGLGPDGWAWTSIGLAIVGVLFLLLYFFNSNRGVRRFGFFAGIVFVLLTVISVFLAQSAAEFRESHLGAVVFEDKVDVKSEPREGATTVFVLHAGTKVNLLDSEEGWFEVEIASGNRGWVKEGDLEEI